MLSHLALELSRPIYSEESQVVRFNVTVQNMRSLRLPQPSPGGANYVLNVSESFTSVAALIRRRKQSPLLEGLYTGRPVAKNVPQSRNTSCEGQRKKDKSFLVK